MKLNAIAASIALASGLALAGTAQAAELVIDDWNINANTGNTITIPPDANPSVLSRTGAPSPAVGGTSLTRGDLYLNKVAGPATNTAQIVDCFECQAGTMSNGTGVISHGYWSWAPLGGLDLTGFSTVSFDYRADLTGGDVILSFWSGGALIGNFLQKTDLAATGDAFAPFSFNLAAVGAPLASVDAIFLDVFGSAGAFNDSNSKFGGTTGLGALNLGNGVDDLDFRIDNFKATNGAPEPGTIALLGLALAGLGVARRRRG